MKRLCVTAVAVLAAWVSLGDERTGKLT